MLCGSACHFFSANNPNHTWGDFGNFIQSSFIFPIRGALVCFVYWYRHQCRFPMTEIVVAARIISS